MNENKRLLENEKILKLLVKFAIPACLALLVSSLYSIIDAVFIGRAAGVLGIGALAVVYPLQVILIAFGQLVGVGAASVLSRSFGSNDIEKARSIAGNAISINLLVTVIFSIFSLIFLNTILTLLGATASILPFSREYAVVILSGSIFLTSGNVLCDLARSEGNIKIGVLAMILGAVINIVLDPIFIFAFSLGIKGAAYATVLSQFITLTILILFILKGKSILRLNISYFKLKWIQVKEMISIGMSSFVRLIVGSFIVIAVNQSLKIYGGDVYISIYGSLTRIMTFLYMPVLGLIQAMQPIIGFNYGMKSKERVLKTIRTSNVVALLIGIVITIVVEIFAQQVIGVFSQDSLFLKEGAIALRIVFIVIPIVSVQMIVSGVFQAIGKARQALILSTIRQFLLLPLVIIVPRLLGSGVNGIWISIPLSDVLATIVTLILLRIQIKDIEKMSG